MAKLWPICDLGILVAGAVVGTANGAVRGLANGPADEFLTPGGQKPGARHPVMVWIHRGALVTGESEDYGPAQLVEDGVTVVTINYRLGALGLLAHPALADANGQLPQEAHRRPASARG